MKNMENEHFNKQKQEKLCFWGGCEQKDFFSFAEMAILKIGKHYLCSERKKTRIFVATICFGKMVLLLFPFKVTKHYKNRGFTRKAICDTQKLCSAENTIFIVLSAKHSFADMKE